MYSYLKRVFKSQPYIKLDKISNKLQNYMIINIKTQKIFYLYIK